MKNKSSPLRRAGKSPAEATVSNKFAQRVIRAPAKRRSCATAAPRSKRQAPVDRKLLRAALAACLKIPASRVTEAKLNKHIRQIQADARQDADLLGSFLVGRILQLERLGCTTPASIERYLEAEEQVLCELYSELGRAHPSPTKLLQSSVQYALDARNVVDVSAQQIVVRSGKAGIEVAVIPSGQVKIRSLPYPGHVIRDLFAIRLLSLVRQKPPAYSEIMQLIETRLQRVPHSTGTEQPTKPAPLIEVDLDESIVLVAGRPFQVSLEEARFVNLLNSEPNVWFGPKEYAQDPLLKLIDRMDRIYKKLPRPIKSLIEGKSGAGYRLSKARLAELRQKSSVVTPRKRADNPR